MEPIKGSINIPLPNIISSFLGVEMAHSVNPEIANRAKLSQGQT